MAESQSETSDPVIERYRAFRVRLRALNAAIFRSVDQMTLDQAASLLGLRRRGEIVARTEGARLALCECCLFDVYHAGKNVAQRFLTRHPPPTPEDAAVAESVRAARFRVLDVRRGEGGGRIDAMDLLRGERLCLIDLGLAASLRAGDVVTVRTLPFEDAWISNGSAFNFPPQARDEALNRLRRHGILARYEDKARAHSPESEVDVATIMLRAAFDFGLDAQLVQRSA